MTKDEVDATLNAVQAVAVTRRKQLATKGIHKDDFVMVYIVAPVEPCLCGEPDCQGTALVERELQVGGNGTTAGMSLTLLKALHAVLFGKDVPGEVDAARIPDPSHH